MFTKFTVSAVFALTGIFLLLTPSSGFAPPGPPQVSKFAPGELVGSSTQGAETVVPRASEKIAAVNKAPYEPAVDQTASAEEPAGDITLMRALIAALLKNPELAAFSQEIRAREAAVLQAKLADQVASAVGNQVKAEEVSPVEETRAKVALATVRTDLTRAERELEAARRRLAALWGSVTPRFAKVLGELETVSPIPTPGQLQKRIHQNPELARWSTELMQRQALVDPEKTKAIPDVTATLGVSKHLIPDDYALVAGMSLPLPVFNRNQGGMLEAERRRGKAIDERRAAEVRVGTALNTAYQALPSAYAEAAACRTSVLPGAESAFETVQKGCRLGQFAQLGALDTQRTLFAARAQYLRALTAYHQGIAEVERLIGERLAFIPNSEESK